MVQAKGQCNEAFEAILVAPVGNDRDNLERAYDLTSDLLDCFWEVKRETLSLLNGNTKSITELEFNRAEGGLLMAQKFLNDMVGVKNAKITK